MWLAQLVEVEHDWNVRAQISFVVCVNLRTKDMASTLRVMVMRFRTSWPKITLVLPTIASAGPTFLTGESLPNLHTPHNLHVAELHLLFGTTRQDWSLEVSFELFPLLRPLLDYEVKSLLDDPNILRDSVLMQLECLYFEAYVHVGAIMWRVVFRELRALTNSKGLELNPFDLNRCSLPLQLHTLTH